MQIIHINRIGPLAILAAPAQVIDYPQSVVSGAGLLHWVVPLVFKVAGDTCPARRDNGPNTTPGVAPVAKGTIAPLPTTRIYNKK